MLALHSCASALRHPHPRSVQEGQTESPGVKQLASEIKDGFHQNEEKRAGSLLLALHIPHGPFSLQHPIPKPAAWDRRDPKVWFHEEHSLSHFLLCQFSNGWGCGKSRKWGLRPGPGVSFLAGGGREAALSSIISSWGLLLLWGVEEARTAPMETGCVPRLVPNVRRAMAFKGRTPACVLRSGRALLSPPFLLSSSCWALGQSLLAAVPSRYLLTEPPLGPRPEPWVWERPSSDVS